MYAAELALSRYLPAKGRSGELPFEEGAGADDRHILQEREDVLEKPSRA